MHKLIVAITIAAMLAFGGCIHVFDQNIVVSQRGNINTINSTVNCNTDPAIKTMASTSKSVPTLDSNGFSLLSWNMQKGVKKGWEKDFRRLSYSKDLLAIQEANLNDAMIQLLEINHHHWDLALAFEYKDIKTGVLTASKIEPSFLYL